MRLGILVYSLTGGGAERVVSYLLAHFQSKNVDTHLILMNDGIVYDIPEGINVHYIERSKSNESGLKKLFKIPLLAYRYAKLSRKLELTHSFSLLTRPNYINLISKYLNKRTKKFIISERAFPSLQYGYGGFKSKINRFLISKLYPLSDSVICNSQGNKNDLIESFGVSDQAITVINNPIDFRKIQRIAPIENFFDKKFFNLVSIGRLDEGKNHKMLISAVANFDNVRLYILGDGVLQSELEELIKSKGLEKQVILLGFQPNPYTYLKNADLFIFGSNHEGFPNVLLEAMACGLPILSTNCKSGPSEILEYNGEEVDNLIITKYGILVPVKDEKLMKKGIEYFQSNHSYHLECKKNIAKRVKDFDTSIILDEFENAIFQK
ncbi:glycosyltransferase [Flagellimonas nanhaiensis]|uniref:Glycosyltransferase n=1 Tax=Flagellimonas nanhaiensis TaxID=2292706 RepID=A0A371JKW7_9FLAO|nr:glycosyltransferase [Allomuricauda nanhaiensis]RDY57592.1 glycosyltransferase [Allomuricauda nanhaiensis]